MQAGFSAIEITPAVGCTLNGFIARLSPSTGVDLPLYVRALLLESNNTRCMILVFDALGLAPAFADRLIEELSRLVGIPAEHIALACTHTHAGPMTAPLRGIGPADESYLNLLCERASEAARAAVANMQPVTAFWGTASVNISVNRRQVSDSDHTAVLGVNPDGPSDHLVRVLKLTSVDRSCILFEHACHAGILAGEHTLISPDFWGHAAKVLRDTGHDSIYLNGCGGDIAPIMAYGGPEASRRTGLMLAEAILKACDTAKPENDPALHVGAVRFDIPYDKLPPIVELEKSLQGPNRTVRDEENANTAVLRKVESAWREWINDLKRAVKPDGGLDPINARLSIIRIGQGAIVALPGEVFYAIGERIAGKLQADPVCMAAYAHGYIGYVPDSEAFGFGGYEVNESHRYVGLWRVSPQSESIIDANVVKLWQQLGGKVR